MLKNFCMYARIIFHAMGVHSAEVEKRFCLFLRASAPIQLCFASEMVRDGWVLRSRQASNVVPEQGGTQPPHRRGTATGRGTATAAPRTQPDNTVKGMRNH